MATKPAQTKTLPATARTVVVACLIPNGLVLQLQKQVDARVPDKESSTGYRIEKQWVKHGRRFVVAGPAYPVGTIPKGYPKQGPVEGGYALTRGVPADFWEEWLEQNKLADFVMPPEGCEHGMIFAYPDMDSAIDAARESEGMRSGMEPLSTDTDKDGKLIDPRAPKPLNPMLGKLENYTVG